jgi:hypothetical protein
MARLIARSRDADNGDGGTVTERRTISDAEPDGDRERGGIGRAVDRPVAFGDAEADPDTEADPDSDADSRADAEPHLDTDAEPHSDTVAEPHADAHSHPDTDAEPHPDTESDAGTDGDPEPDADPQPWPDPDALAQPDAHRDADAHCDAHPDPDAGIRVLTGTLSYSEPHTLSTRRWRSSSSSTAVDSDRRLDRRGHPDRRSGTDPDRLPARL